MKVLTAFYDLKVSPTTYDITSFLFLAEMWRRGHNLDVLDLIVVANDAFDGFRENERDTPKEQKEWMLHHVLLRCDTLVKACRRVAYFPDREEARRLSKRAHFVYPARYDIDSPNTPYLAKETVHLGLRGYPYAAFEPTQNAIQYIDNWLSIRAHERKTITITLRESQRQESRNSNFPAWLKFAKSLDQGIYFPLFLRDTGSIFTPPNIEFDGFHCCDLSSLNLELRMALYARAYLNLLVNNGPNNLLIHNPNARFIQFRPSGGGTNTTEEYLATGGLTRDYAPVLRTTYQKVLFDTDTFENISLRFEQMVENIEANLPIKYDDWDSPEIWFERFIETGAFKDAERLLDLVSDNSDDPDAVKSEFEANVLTSVNFLIKAGHKGAALNGMHILVERNPNNIELGFNLLAILLQLGTAQEILTELERLESLSAELSGLQLLWAEILKKEGRHSEALGRLDIHLNHTPDHVDALILYAEILGECGDMTSRETLLLRVLSELPPNDSERRARILANLEK